VTPTPPPSRTDRLLSASFYLGLGPIIRFWPSHSLNRLRQHHYQQAMAAFFLVLMVFLATCVLEVSSCFIVIHDPSLLEHQVGYFGGLPFVDDVELLVIAAVIGLWMTLLVLALKGSTRQMPLLKQVSGRMWPSRVSCFINTVVLLLVPLTVTFALWATSLTRRSGEDARVFFLYDEGIPVPRWGYAMGLSRVALQAQMNWGKGSTALDRLNRNTLRTALTNGRVLILATHGDAGYAITYYSPEILGVWPAEVGATDEAKSPRFLCTGVRATDDKWGKLENVRVNNQLELAYIFACNAGKKASQWREHLAPAKVVAYDRFSTFLDHALWFAFTGPSELKALR
jgi:hypothetical protein